VNILLFHNSISILGATVQLKKEINNNNNNYYYYILGSKLFPIQNPFSIEYIGALISVFTTVHCVLRKAVWQKMA